MNTALRCIPTCATTWHRDFRTPQEQRATHLRAPIRDAGCPNLAHDTKICQLHRDREISSWRWLLGLHGMHSRGLLELLSSCGRMMFADTTSEDVESRHCQLGLFAGLVSASESCDASQSNPAGRSKVGHFSFLGRTK